MAEMRADEDLIRLCRETGDRRAYAELYERHKGSARAAAAALRVPRSEREDVVAEAFANVLAALRRGGGPVEAFRPYLIAAVRNITFSQARRAARADDGCRRLAVEANIAALPQPEPNDAVVTAFDQLPERWRRILIAVEVEGRRPADLADELGLTPNAVSALIARARRGLRQNYLGAIGTGEEVQLQAS